VTAVTCRFWLNATPAGLSESDDRNPKERHSMVFAIFLILLGIFSACLMLAGIAFYAGWDAKCQMERELHSLTQRATQA
jgi:hypothetical protein